ncbi:MAG: hypothetical protein ACP59X_23695 [Solidesulfovibrio sp. DCME]|uniref:hypothetical protein n=1 Tax=Solidesulfovibrio sp. DCME TaxID=3447380 RepID=UPI003D10F251
MKLHAVFVAALCCLLACGPAAAKSPPPAKHQPAKKAAPAQADHETVETPGKVIKEPNAFHGTKWGTPMAAVPDLTVVEKDGQAAYATVEGAVYRIGDAFLNNMVYGFCQDKFAAVMVDYKGAKAHESIRKFLIGKYTPPVEVEDKPEDLAWPLGNVLIRLQFFKDKDAGTLSYFYQPLFAPCSGPGGTAPQ